MEDDKISKLVTKIQPEKKVATELLKTLAKQLPILNVLVDLLEKYELGEKLGDIQKQIDLLI